MYGEWGEVNRNDSHLTLPIRARKLLAGFLHSFCQSSLGLRSFTLDINSRSIVIERDICILMATNILRNDAIYGHNFYAGSDEFSC